jgi:hypothetical protein
MVTSRSKSEPTSARRLSRLPPGIPAQVEHQRRVGGELLHHLLQLVRGEVERRQLEDRGPVAQPDGAAAVPLVLALPRPHVVDAGHRAVASAAVDLPDARLDLHRRLGRSRPQEQADARPRPQPVQPVLHPLDGLARERRPVDGEHLLARLHALAPGVAAAEHVGHQAPLADHLEAEAVLVAVPAVGRDEVGVRVVQRIEDHDQGVHRRIERGGPIDLRARPGDSRVQVDAAEARIEVVLLHVLGDEPEHALHPSPVHGRELVPRGAGDQAKRGDGPHGKLTWSGKATAVLACASMGRALHS